MIFYLGTPRASWLSLTNVPLFISAVQLRKRKSFPRARGRWALDSGGFSELDLHGRWTIDAATYVTEVRRWINGGFVTVGRKGKQRLVWRDGVGMPDFAAIQDWMCEPIMLAKTGLTVREHQARTLASFLELRRLAPEVPWMPILQGWECDDYLDHIDQYSAAGVDLTAERIVGVGTICKRQASSRAARIIRAIALQRIRIHAFGVKSDGIRLFGDWIESADSMAWSYVARRRPVLLDVCVGGTHKNCANCMRWALEWHRTRIETAPRQAQTNFPGWS